MDKAFWSDNKNAFCNEIFFIIKPYFNLASQIMGIIGIAPYKSYDLVAIVCVGLCEY